MDDEQKLTNIHETTGALSKYGASGYTTPSLVRQGKATGKTSPRASGISEHFNESQIVEEEIKLLEHQLQQMRTPSTQTHDQLGTPVARPSENCDVIRKVRFSEDASGFPNLSTPARDRIHVTRRKHRNVKAYDHTHDTDSNDDGINDVNKKTKSVMVKAATYDGSTALIDYLSHFEACASINGWTNYEKGLYLAVSLRGQAQGILGDLSEPEQVEYSALKKALQERFAPPNQTELYRVQLLERKQRATESLPELGQAIRRLVKLAYYPTVPTDVRDTLARQQFIESLAETEMRIRIKQARPENLNDAICLAVELDAYNRAEKRGEERRAHLRSANVIDVKEQKSTVSQSTSFEKELASMQRSLNILHQEIKQLKAMKHEKSPGSQFQSKERRCYHCNETGHLRRNCPKRESGKIETQKNHQPSVNPVRSRRKKEKGQSRMVGISAPGQEAGLYINATVQSLNVKLLVDTGATVSIISKSVYEAIPERLKPRLEKVTQEILTASGKTLEVLGRGGFVIKPDGCDEMHFDAVVANISTNGLVGLDFMKGHDVIIELQEGCLKIDGKRIPMNYEGTLGCYRVFSNDKVVIPAKSEMIIHGKVKDPLRKTDSSSLLVEGCDEFFKKEKALVARSLVSNQESIPVRVMNLQEEPQVIYPGTSIAKASLVQEVLAAEVPQTLAKREGKLRPDLCLLLDKSKEYLSDDQYTEVEALLQEYEKLFAESDADLGRTSVIKHSINTGNSTPIKQPFRRVPAHLAPVVDKQVQEMLDRNVIQKSTSPWSSGIVLVKKKDGSLRFCVDYRRLNSVSVPDAYPFRESMRHWTSYPAAHGSPHLI